MLWDQHFQKIIHRRQFKQNTQTYSLAKLIYHFSFALLQIENVFMQTNTI